MTPTITNDAPEIRIVFPSTSRFPPNRRIHNSWLKTASLTPPGVLRVVRASEQRFETEDVKVVPRRRQLQDRLRLGIGKFDHAVMPNPSVKMTDLRGGARKFAACGAAGKPAVLAIANVTGGRPATGHEKSR